MKEKHSEIIIYKTENGLTNVEVKFDKETVWLSQKEIAILFGKDADTIGLHLRNIFKSGELTKKSTTEKSSVVQLEGNREVRRSINLYNLNAIISVGYRVNSKKGTQFRIWSTQQLKKHLIEGYSINEKRLKQLQQTIQLLKKASLQISNTDEAQDLMHILSEYSKALDILDDYDHQNLSKVSANQDVTFSIDYDEAMIAISQLREKFGGSNLFGNEKDQSFKSSIAVIDQTFDGKLPLSRFRRKSS